MKRARAWLAVAGGAIVIAGAAAYYVHSKQRKPELAWFAGRKFVISTDAVSFALRIQCSRIKHITQTLENLPLSFITAGTLKFPENFSFLL
jgi:hypothetical protein